MQPHIDPQCETIKFVQQCKMEERLQPRPQRCISEEEYRRNIASLKNNKAAGIHDVLGEQLNNLGTNSQVAACNAQ